MKETTNVTGAYSHCIETKNFNTVLDHATNSDTLVILDVDNTLVHTGQELGCDAWAHWTVKQRLAEGYSPQEAIEYMFALFGHVHDHLDVYPVESEAVDVLNTLRERAISSIVLTGRPGFMVQRTQQQLDKLGLSLNVPGVFKINKTLNLMQPVVMANGIICGGINDKGDVLSNIFKTLNISCVRSIVFIDDKKSCVDSIGASCRSHGIGYTGIRYGRMDEALFNPQKAHEQLELLLSKHIFTSARGSWFGAKDQGASQL